MKSDRRTRVEIPLRHAGDAKPVPIVSDAMMATVAMGEGRMIPVLILDTTSRHDIDTMVLAHSEFGPGDATSIWPSDRFWFGAPSGRLVLRMTGPSECVVIVEFDVERQGILVSQILYAQGVYIQPGRPGDRLATTLNKPRVLVEVPRNREFRHRWERLFAKANFKRLRKKGLSRAEAKYAVKTATRDGRRYSIGEWVSVAQRLALTMRKKSNW